MHTKASQTNNVKRVFSFPHSIQQFFSYTDILSAEIEYETQYVHKCEH